MNEEKNEQTPESAAGNELTDEQLEQVTGGLSWEFSIERARSLAGFTGSNES